MTIARSKLVDVSVSRWYHCISRCVRQAFLIGKATPGLGRKAWLENRLKELDKVFAISVGGFAVMDNHLHLLLRLDPQVAAQWTAIEVVTRWHQLFPPRDPSRKPLSSKDRAELVNRLAQDSDWVSTIRDRLSSISWFMKCLKEPLARLANREENCKGAFFEGRFKSIAVLDEEALLAICAYIDLNLVAAGKATVPEESAHTSIKQRVDHVKQQNREGDLAVAKHGSVSASRAARDLEDGLWLVPVEDRRRIESKREGMREGFTLGNYLLLVEYTGRVLRHGKESIGAEVADVFDRLGCTQEAWYDRISRLKNGSMIGRVLAASRERLKAVSKQWGLRRIVNLSGIRAA